MMIIQKYVIYLKYNLCRHFFLLKDKKCINTLNGADIKGIKKMLNIKD